MNPNNRVNPPQERVVHLPLYNIDHIPDAEIEAQGMVRGAVVNVRYSTSEIMDSAAEVLACGTAVRIK